MSLSKSLRLFLVLVTVCCLSWLASAGVIRHDRDDALYTELANLPEYDCVGQLRYTDNLGGHYLASGIVISPQ